MSAGMLDGRGGAKDETDPVFDRPIFIVSAPRSGSTLLFEVLSKVRDIYTIGGESHQMIEQVPGLRPRDRGFDSNALSVIDATPERTQQLRDHFHAALHDSEGRRPSAGARVRMLEKTPKNALRIEFLAHVFPESRFVFLHRDARETVGSMIDAWRSGNFRTYPGLPQWPQLPWSLRLVPGWRELASKPLHEVVSTQWKTTMECLLDSLDGLPQERWCALDYTEFLADPSARLQALCKALGLSWENELSGPLPWSRYTLTPPARDKWRKHGASIESVLPQLQPTMERANRMLKQGAV